MKIWVDLANSPHVPFFRALGAEFGARGHSVHFSARDYAQTVQLAALHGLDVSVLGVHGGAGLRGKLQSIVGRARALAHWASGQQFDLAVSHNSYAQTLAARWRGIPAVTLMDYEHQPANHVAFRLAQRVIVPQCFPAAALKRFGARAQKVRRYAGIKEDVYLAEFELDPGFVLTLANLEITAAHTLVVLRPPAREALYHRFENELFDRLLMRLAQHPDVRVLFLPRTLQQLQDYKLRIGANFITPMDALDGANLIAHADLVISAGGTMNREAAALGIPAATVYAGEWCAVDDELVRASRMLRLASRDDVDQLVLGKKPHGNKRRMLAVKAQVADLILD